MNFIVLPGWPIPTAAFPTIGVGGALLVAFGVVLLIVVVLMLFRRSRLKKVVAKRTSRSQESMQKRVTEARTQLLYADEAVRTAKDEVTFASAQFGVSSVDEMKAQVEAAEAGLARGYQLLAQMDAAETLGQQAQIAKEINQIINQVMPPLAASLSALQQQRNAEADLDSRARELRERIADMQGQLAAAQGELKALKAAYPAQAIESLLDNPAQTRTLLDSAEQALAQMEELLPTDRSGALQKAELCAHQISLAKLQIDAIMNGRKTIQNASKMLASAIGSITADLNDVARLVADQSVFAPLVDEAKAAIGVAQNAARGESDPLAALERLHAAEEALDAALAPLRSAEETQKRAADQARERLNQVELLVARADEAVQQKRSALSLDARSEVSQANAQLEAARGAVDSNPDYAMQCCAQAERLARSALQKAQSAPIQNDNFDMEDVLLWTTVIGSTIGMASRRAGRFRGGPGPRWGGGFGSGHGGGHRGPRMPGF